MFFRNVTFFRFPASVAKKFFAPSLDPAMQDEALKPVGPLDAQSQGWGNFLGLQGGDAMAYYLSNTVIGFTLVSETKILPSYVVTDITNKRILAMEEKQGRKLGGKARRAVKEDVVHELLPKAFVKPGRLNAFIDLDNGYLAIDTASRKQAESFVSHLRHTLGSFPAIPLNAENSARTVMTDWLAGDLKMSDSLDLGSEVQLQESDAGSATAKCQHQVLDGEEIKKHLESGKSVSRLGLVVANNVSFVLGEDLVLRKLKFLDGAVESLETGDQKDQLEEIDARFALMSAELARVFKTLDKSLKFSKADA